MKKSIPPLVLGRQCRVKIEGLGSFGEGLTHFEGHEIFVPKVAPGDEVLVEICESKKGRYRANVLNFLKQSEHRDTPLCRHFLNCGGCDFQHITYEDQLAWKLRMTKHWIRRSPLAPYLDSIPFEVLESPNRYHYRHRVRLQIRNHKLHFFRPHSNSLLELSECPVLREDFFNALATKAQDLPDTKDSNHTYIDNALVEGESSFEMDGHDVHFTSACFTQANLEVNQKIWSVIKEEALKLESKNRALDLFCGIGNFTLPLSDHFTEIIGVESEPNSIQMARKNSTKVKWIEDLSENVLRHLESKREFFDFVLLDPPRAGARPCIDILVGMLPAKIIYVSCSLESLVPDLMQLVKKGRYRITRWAVADMFPQTHHIESVVSLDRKL